MKYYESSKKKISINLTGLIDIIFLIVIFFALTSKFDTERAKNLSLPESTEKTKVEQRDRLTIGVDENRQISIGQETFSMDRLEQFLADYQGDRNLGVLLRIDQNLSHGFVISFLDLLEKYRFREISFATEPKPTEEN